jgi:hypothetical protein
LGLDRAGLSPRLLQKVVYAGSNATSCKQARAFLKELAGYDCKERFILRTCHRIGHERLEQRAQQVASYAELTLAQRDLAPCTAPDLIAIMGAGGTMQMRPEDEAAATGADETANAATDAAGAATETANAATDATTAPTPVAARPGDPEAEDETEKKDRCWRGNKVGILVHLAPTNYEIDPCPQLPEVFRDPLVVLKLAREVGHADLPAGAGKFQGAQTEEEGDPDVEDVADETDDATPASAAETPADKKTRRRPGAPQVLERRVLATRQRSAAFGPMLAALAWSMGFLAAKRGAFVGDGAAWLWRIQQRFFPRLTPVVDFIHVLSYVFAAALAGRAKLEEGWPVYQEWITWVWKGEIERVLTALRQRLEELAAGNAARETVEKSLGFLEGQKERMHYARYRQEGLPIMSSLIESTVKQIGRRVKGSEKFWTEEGAEALLQRRADYLSDDQPMTHFWRERTQRLTGQNPYHRKAG